MIKKLITNTYNYKGDGSDKNDDSFICHYEVKIYFMGILLWVKELNEDITRENVIEKKVGYRK
jgi:hypothetical protein